MPDEPKIELAVGPRAIAPQSSAAEMHAIVRGEHSDPFHILGPHREAATGKHFIIVRVFRPDAASISVLWNGERAVYPAIRVHPDGLFVATIPQAPGGSAAQSEQQTLAATAYKLRITFADGRSTETYDPYAFPPVLTEFDLHLMGEGTHYLKYEKLGAHVREIDGVHGVHFAVWAPNARRVSVVGDFNHWDGRTNPMRHCGSSGVWELFPAGPRRGRAVQIRNYLAKRGAPRAQSRSLWILRGGAAEIRICGVRHRSLRLARRGMDVAAGKRDWLRAPISIYEVHLGSWRRSGSDGKQWLSYRELADKLIPYAKSMGFTHLELMPDDGASLRRLLGLSNGWLFRADQPLRQAGRFHVLRGSLPRGRARRDSRLDARPLSRATRMDSPTSTALIFTSTPIRAKARIPIGALSFSITAATKCRIFSFRMRSSGSTNITSTVCAWMPLLRCSTSITRAKQGEWLPNQYGGRENLEAIAFIKRMNEVVHERHPGALTIAEESTAWPAVSRPTYVGGSDSI